MTVKKLSLDYRLSLDKYELDEQSHITVDQSRCQVCAQKPCLTVCPAEVYRQVKHKIVVAYENCLECGACEIACDTGGEGGIDWRYPRGGFGIIFRYG